MESGDGELASRGVVPVLLLEQPEAAVTPRRASVKRDMSHRWHSSAAVAQAH
jgi:hypothetical protein